MPPRSLSHRDRLRVAMCFVGVVVRCRFGCVHLRTSTCRLEMRHPVTCARVCAVGACEITHHPPPSHTHATTSRAGAPGVQAAVISYTPSAQTTVSRGPLYRHAQSPACVVSPGAPLARVSPHNTNRSTEMCFFICLRGNDPSAGSPTETLLRLHLPLNGKV